MMDVGRPPETVWRRPDIRAALSAGDWTTVLRAALDTGMSQSEIAALVGISQAQVCVSRTVGTGDPAWRQFGLCATGPAPRPSQP